MFPTQRGVGHMWQNRYYSCPLQPSRVWSVIRYVELNPVRAGMVERATDYAWSSAAAHINGADVSGVLDMGWWKSNWTQGDWAIALTDDPGDTDAIRRATYTGRPCDDREFIAGLEQETGRKLGPQKGGRPKKIHLENSQDTMQLRLTTAAGSHD